MLFTVSNPLGLCVGILFLIFAYAISGIPPRMITKSLKPVIPIIIFTTVLNMFFVKGDPLFDWWFSTFPARTFDGGGYDHPHYLPDRRHFAFNLYDLTDHLD